MPITKVNSLGITNPVAFSAGTASLPSITTSGDTNTGAFFPAADTIAFTEGGAEAMRIDSSGNLLIGTTSAPIGVTNSLVPINGNPGIIGGNLLYAARFSSQNADTFNILIKGTAVLTADLDVVIIGGFGNTNREGYAAYRVICNRTTDSITTITEQTPTNTGGTFTTSFNFVATKPNTTSLNLAITKASGAVFSVGIRGFVFDLISEISTSNT
jgi:hypothetical protein